MSNMGHSRLGGFAMTTSRILMCAAIAAALGVTSASANRVLPTVNKIDFQTGDRSTLQLYQGLSSAPIGVTCVPCDLDGDGFAEFATIENWGDPHENVNGVIVRGWDYTVKAQVFPPDMTRGPRQVVVSGILEDANANPISTLIVSTNSDVPSARYHNWEWEDSSGRLTNLQTAEPFPPPSDYDSAISMAINPLATDEYGLVVGSQDKVTGYGHVTVLKRGEPAQPGNSFQMSDNTFGGGVRVATGDVDGDGRAEICTMSIGQTLGSQGTLEACIDLSVIFVEDAPQDSFNYSKIEFEYKPQRKSDYLDIGVLPGGIACGDVDGDGLPELIFTSSENDGPRASYFDIISQPTARFGALHDISLVGLEDKDKWNKFTILEPSFTSVPFSPSEGQPMGSLLLSTLVVPEPTTLMAFGAIGAFAIRRRRA